MRVGVRLQRPLVVHEVNRLDFLMEPSEAFPWVPSHVLLSLATNWIHVDPFL